MSFGGVGAGFSLQKNATQKTAQIAQKVLQRIGKGLECSIIAPGMSVGHVQSRPVT